MSTLHDIDTKVSHYYAQDFGGITWTDRRLVDMEFAQCTFADCSWVECSFENCEFTDCTFTDSVLSAIKPINSTFMEVHFCDSKIIGFDWAVAKSVRFLDFKTCQLNYSNFSFLKLHQLKMRDCIVHEATFADADLTGGDFRGTDFENSIFSHTNLTNCDFVSATHYTIDTRVNTVRRAKFSLPEAATLLTSLDIILE